MLLLLKPIFFATDIMLFIFSAITLLWAYKIKTKHNIYKQWEPLFKNKIYSSCFVVLSFFYGIALLDSFHFKIPVENQNNNEVYSNHVNSVFDKLVSPLGTVEEQTYSKPFATTNLNKSYIKQKNGSYESFYKPLKLTANSSNYSFSSILFECVKNISLLLLVMAIYIILKQKLWCKSKIKLISFKPSSMMFTFIICCSTLITIITISQYYHIFGTNKVGQDVCFQALKSIRTGIILGTITTLFSLPVAITLGISSGYFGKVIDDIIQYIYTTISAIPGILLISAAILSLQVWLGRNSTWFNSMQESADIRLLIICFILGITGWTSLCRLLRGETLKIREMDFITAAKTMGVSKFNILFRHILPNVMHIVLIITVIDFSGLVLAEAVLSYIGVGVDPTTTSWGNMINSARLELARDPAIWWSLAASFTFMSIMVLAANIFAEGVREIFDPRSKNN